MKFAKPREKPPRNKIKERIRRAFKGHDFKTWIWIVLLLGIGALTVASTIKLLQDSSWIFGIVLKYAIRPITTFGGWGIVLYFVFMGIQGVFAPLPSEVMLLACGLLWGPWLGTGMALAGLMVAAVLAYEIGVRGGKPVAEKFIGDDLYVLDYYMHKFGNPTLLITRAIPVLSYDPISFAAGFFGIKRRDYLITSLFGSIPRSLFFAIIGTKMNTQDRPIADILANEHLLNDFIKESSSQFNALVIWMGVIMGVMFIIYRFWLSKYLRWKRIEKELGELNTAGHLEEDGFSQHTMEALLTGEIPHEAHHLMGLFIQTDDQGGMMIEKTVDIMGNFIIEGEIPPELDDKELHYPYAEKDQRLWLRLAKTYRLLLKNVFETRDPNMIGRTLEGLGHCYYKLGDTTDAGILFTKAKIIYHQAGNRVEADRVEEFASDHGVLFA